MATFIFTIIVIVPIVALLWWLWAHMMLRNFPGARWWQGVVAVFSLVFLVCFAGIVGSRFASGDWLPHTWLLAMVMLWGLILMPFVALPLMIAWSTGFGVRWVWVKVRDWKRDDAVQESGPLEADASRRQFLGATLATFPMIITLGATAVSIPQKTRFRIRTIETPIVGLPRQLDGLRIAHVSDTHVGRFTRGEVLGRIVKETNRLEADLVVHTGDLIDHSIGDLPEAVDMLKKFDRRQGMVMIEGNHDLFQGREPFVEGVRESGVPILLDEDHTIRVNDFPVQFMGIMWHMRERPIEHHVDRATRFRDPDAFQILLAHHPHAWDRAKELEIPLTLAGHTHGGQLMLNDEYGAGPMIYKYWSGLYQEGNSAAIISNGVGNWFPLRTSAPAEIVHVILRRV